MKTNTRTRTILQEYARLVIHASFQSKDLLEKIRLSTPKSPEREIYENLFKTYWLVISEYITKTQEEIVIATRKNKAARLVVEGERNE